MKTKIQKCRMSLRRAIAGGLASASILALATPATVFAQDAEPTDQPSVDESAIVVFARREAENE